MKLVAALVVLGGCLLHAAEPDVVVLDSTDIGFMHEALQRIDVPFHRADKPDGDVLSRHRIVVLAGKDLPLDALSGKQLEQYLRSGGRILAVGGGAKWMLDQKLFDASGYYPTGTTTFMSKFDGYHRLTFGYPVASPKENWTYGVPNLLRATDGPLMRLGPQAHAVLAAGGPFSLMAYQRFGKGIALLIGPDPQGGYEYQSLGNSKPTAKRGNELDTDRLLANSIAWLRNESGNLIPNSGFEVLTEGGPEKSHWELIANNGGVTSWRRDGAPEGKVFVTLKRKDSASAANLSPYVPIAVESGAAYRFSCWHRSTIGWRVVVRHIRSLEDGYSKAEQKQITVAAADDWTRYETEIVVPEGIRLLGFILQPAAAGKLSLDDIQLEPTITDRQKP
jgi:hypothetical protein